MIGRSISEFISELYNNPEMEFAYHNERFMISGYVDSNTELYTLELWNITKNQSLFEYSDAIRENCIERFESAQIFEGKTIYEIESEITVLYG